MAVFEYDSVRLNYEVHGDGFPVLLIAPGGMRSQMDAWPDNANPLKILSNRFKLIAMDQRNAGQSFAPVRAQDGWASYRQDQLNLLDHLGVERCHIMGMCIGGPYIMGLSEAAPDRIAATVMYQPIGHDGTNRQLFIDMFNGWKDEIADQHPEATDADWANFCKNMYSGEFLFNTSEDQAQACNIPSLILMGQDPYHPESISRRLADLMPNAILVEAWKEGPDNEAATGQVINFLTQHSS